MSAVDAGDRAMAEAVARSQIRECLARYCHGIDRCDADTLKSAYWPDAYEEHGTYEGPAWDFADHMTASMRADFLCSTQMIGNVLIDLDGDRARVETYVLAMLQQPDGMDRTISGRYLDRFERRGGEWRILRRLYVLDWHRDQPRAADSDAQGLYAMLRTRGARFPDDPWDRQRPDHAGAPGQSEASHG